MKTVIAVRGATTLACDSKEEIEKKTNELISAVLQKNGLPCADTQYVSLLISTTQDIHSFYPARAVRESGLLDVPLFSCVEPDIKGALPLCIRIMLTLACEKECKPHHVYLHGAAALRPDLADK